MKDPVYELKAEVPAARVAYLEELLAESEEHQLMVLEDKVSARAWLAGYFATESEAAETWGRFASRSGWNETLVGPSIELLPDKNWKESYKEHFKAWQFGRLHWVPVWERERFILPEGHEVLWLDPGLAFGTGNHETTRLVVERMVASAMRRGTTGRVIDAGCGSGILALSAAKLGYRDIVAFDNDPVAVEVSDQNAGLNELGGRVQFFVGDLVTGLAGRQAEVVLANIQADVLMTFADELVRCVAPGGILILSGILALEVDRVREVFVRRANNWTIESRTMGEWCDLVLEWR